MPRLVLLLLAAPTLALAWEDHAPLTAAALAGEPALSDAAGVEVEPIEAFAVAERDRLGPLLEAEEQWARAHVAEYPPRPDALRFSKDGDPATLPRRLLEAMRVSPETVLLPHVQQLPGEPDGGRPALPWGAISTLPPPPHHERLVFRALRAGERVSPLAVIAEGSDEPDHGLDIGLFEDSGTAFGARFGYGRQPFGNPRLPFATQAPFHMGFFHEARLLTALVPSLRRVYPEARIHAFATLARFAFDRGHPYWGWRFLGMGLHYVQDLTQPYHATVYPGASVLELIAVSALDLAGVHGPRQRRMELLTDLHLGLELRQFEIVWNALAAPRRDAPVLAALRDRSRDEGVGPYDDAAPRARISLAAARAAPRTARAAAAALAPGAAPDRMAALDAVLVDLLGACGAVTRAYLHAVVPASGGAARAPAPRSAPP